MARPGNIDDLDLSTVKGRLAYAIKSKGPSFVAERTSLASAQVSRLSRQLASTTLENAAEIAIVTGFELKWIALGEGPMKVDDELWEHTNTFKKVPQLDVNQNADFSFDPEFLTQQKVTAEQCRIWEVNCNVDLANLKRGYTVLIDTQQTQGSGIFVLESNSQRLIGEMHINLDGSAKFQTDISKPNTDQDLTKEQLSKLTTIGKVIWQGGQS